MELMAHMINLVSTANHRDGISTKFMLPEVHVFPNGELDVDGNFYEATMFPYVQALF
jgi:hypothetical protein